MMMMSFDLHLRLDREYQVFVYLLCQAVRVSLKKPARKVLTAVYAIFFFLCEISNFV
jgi:hypothetical protein